MKNKILSFFLLTIMPIFSNQSEFPRIMDFDQTRIIEGHHLDETDSWSGKLTNLAFMQGLVAFNGIPEIGLFVHFLQNEYQIDAAVETGTCTGATALFLGTCFKEVHTIEIENYYYNKAKPLFESHPTIHNHLGSSETILRQILPSLQDKRLLFYLDAHWYSLPLLDELEEISKTHKDNCIIIIDDFKVPGRPDISYDTYGESECSYEYIKEQLDKVYTEYSFHYLIPSVVSRRAKFVAIPLKWTQKNEG